MTGARSTAAVLKAAGSANLALYKGGGYWYFIYDDGGKLYASYSVMTVYLNSLSLERWAAIGRAFVSDVEAGNFAISSHY